jgi:hydrogenase/urease accessory protein HupE
MSGFLAGFKDPISIYIHIYTHINVYTSIHVYTHIGDMSGFLAGFKDPISMVDSSAFDPDKSYKDSKLCNVRTSTFYTYMYLYLNV